MPLMAKEMSKETSAKLMKEGEHHSYNKSGLEFQYQKNSFYWLVRARRFFRVSNYSSKRHRHKSGTFVGNTVAPFCAQSKVIKEGFDYMCQQVRDSIGSLAAWFKMKYTIVLPVWLSRFAALLLCIAFTQVLREQNFAMSIFCLPLSSLKTYSRRSKEWWQIILLLMPNSYKIQWVHNPNWILVT